MSADTKRTANDTLQIPVYTGQKIEDYRAVVFLHGLSQYMFQNWNNNNEYFVFMKISPLVGRRIRIGRRRRKSQPIIILVHKNGSHCYDG